MIEKDQEIYKQFFSKITLFMKKDEFMKDVCKNLYQDNRF